MQKTKLRYLKQMFYLHLVNLILAQYSTKSAPFNGHYPKWQFLTYTWFSHALSHTHKYQICFLIPANITKYHVVNVVNIFLGG